ncbi:hypothetical protein Tco_0735943, partial [Tanacetum coccineum]
MTQAQQRTCMCNYIKNIGSHTLQQLKKLSFDEIKELFKTTMKRVQDFVPMESDRLVPKISTRSSKRIAETELEHEGSKRKKTNKEQSVEEEKELSEEELQKLMMIVPVEEVYIEALQVELKRLFKRYIDDILWKLQRYMHDPLTWRLYDTCGVHHVSTGRGHDIFMLVEKDYPLSKGVLILMLLNKLLVEQPSEMANELLRKIFIQAERPGQEYDLWSMMMEQYLTFTYHALWEVIVNGDSVSQIASASASAEGPIPPKTAEQKLARKNELKAKSTLMLAI